MISRSRVFLKDQVACRPSLYMLGWQEDFHDPHDWVTPYLASGGTYAHAQAFQVDVQKQVDDLINKAVTSTDEAARVLTCTAKSRSSRTTTRWTSGWRSGWAAHYEQSWVKGWYYNPIYPGEPETGTYFLTCYRRASNAGRHVQG